jgi:hypothetical protein
MKKSDMLELVTGAIAGAVAILNENGISKAIVAGVKDELSKIVELVTPKTGGVAMDVNEVANFDSEGNVTAILCSLSKRWLPVYDAEGNENFYTDAKSEKFGGFKRLSKAAESIRQKHSKALKATEAAVLADLLNPEVALNETEAKSKIEAAKVIDYTVIGSETRPVA